MNKQSSLFNKIVIFCIVSLIIGIIITPIISANIKINEKIVNEYDLKDRIENRFGLKYVEEGYLIKNNLIEKDTNPVNTYNNGPGEINPIWITKDDFGYFYTIKAYNGYIYAVGKKYYPEGENNSAILAKFDITNGELLWIKSWEGFHPCTQAYDLEFLDDSIYVVGCTGPPGFVGWWIDSFICKYNLNGKLLWSKLINETTFDNFNGVKLYDNYFYLCGSRSVSDGLNAWILKYDTDGNKIWGKTYKVLGAWFGEFLDLEIYNDFIYTEGQTSSWDNSEQDVLVAKISLDGKLDWKREWGGNGPQLGARIHVMDEFIYVCGYGKEESVLWGGHDILLKYDLDGTLEWDTTSLCSPATAIDVIAYNGSLYTGGEFLRFEYDYDAVLFKFNEDSSLIWYLTYGPYGFASINSIEVYKDFLYICGNIGAEDFIMKYDVDLFSDNNKPATPSKLSGPTDGKPDVEYTYSTNTTDPDEDLLSYDFSWGDWNITTVEWYDSGESVSSTYSWDEKGIYDVKVRARDEYGFVSNWSDPIKVNIPRNKATYYSFFLWFLKRFPILERLLNLII